MRGSASGWRRHGWRSRLRPDVVSVRRRQPPAAGGRVEGTATAVRVDVEGSRSVLRFVLRVDDDRIVPVEMRGDEVRGVLTEGDRVAIDGFRPGETLRPTSIDDLTTASPVEVWAPTGIGRLLAHGELRTAALSAVVTSGIGLAVGWLQSEPSSGAGPGPIAPTPPPDEGGPGAWPFVARGRCGARRPRRADRRPAPPAAPTARCSGARRRATRTPDRGGDRRHRCGARGRGALSVTPRRCRRTPHKRGGSPVRLEHAGRGRGFRMSTVGTHRSPA